MGGGVRRVVLDESVLFGCEDPTGKASLLPAAEYLFRKLRHSTIPTVILIKSASSNCPCFFFFTSFPYFLSNQMGFTCSQVGVW